MAEAVLKNQITDNMKNAMRAKDTALLGVIRLILSAIKQQEVDQRIVLTDEQVIGILEKMIKQRKDSVSQFLKANRNDLADKETFEIEVIKKYMPAALEATEIDAIITAAIETAGATSPKEMGNVIKIIKPQVAGKADMGEISKAVKNKLAS